MKPRKQESQDRRKALNLQAQQRELKRNAKGQDSRKVHDTKGKNTHGRTFR